MLTHLQKKIKALHDFSFELETKRIIEAHKDKLADLQASQLARSRDSNNEEIRLKDNAAFGFGYRPFTIRQKLEHGSGLGAVTSRVTWFMSGQLYGSLKADIRTSTFAIISNNFKFQKLIARSGEEAIGLNVESRTDFITEITRPLILKAYHDKVTMSGLIWFLITH